eukprot:Gb_38562 [translate_table: standard]
MSLKICLEYLDLNLIHLPIKLKKGTSHLIPKEEEFFPLDIKFIKGWSSVLRASLSNFSYKKIEDVLSYANILPAVNQVEMHPLWQQKKLRDYYSKVNIHASAYYALGGLSNPWGSNAMMENCIIQEIVRRHGKTMAQVLLRWGLEKGVSVLPKSYNKGRITKTF